MCNSFWPILLLLLQSQHYNFSYSSLVDHLKVEWITVYQSINATNTRIRPDLQVFTSFEVANKIERQLLFGARIGQIVTVPLMFRNHSAFVQWNPNLLLALARFFSIRHLSMGTLASSMKFYGNTYVGCIFVSSEQSNLFFFPGCSWGYFELVTWGRKHGSINVVGKIEDCPCVLFLGVAHCHGLHHCVRTKARIAKNKK
jgi:hypothetical protein